MAIIGGTISPHINDSLTAYGAAVYSSNGLFCVELFSESQRSLWLWNPAIRKVQQVPKSLNNYEGESFSVGFGFSSIINDYKMVKLFTSDFLVAQVEVYALGTGLWTKVEPGNLKGVRVSHPSAFNCNGAIFWVGMKEGVEEDRKIVSFDIAMELFTLISFPPMTSASQSCFHSPTMSQNKLALLSPTVIENSDSYLIDLWVLEECTDPCRERWNWTKMYTSRPNPFTFSIIPQIIWRNEIVCSVFRVEYPFGGEP
ncbi:F-box/kelch-repeat protein At3g06240-like [Neltuma alba]|uniref:F-box/kelch-repeat protein At3g06240-like n=1 Tax=Neltuma alba TaxID=207710 RepID=UPI0010A450DE|nr:F-box/kelch-repeat protein At3g06240-like [Prosopis alba]